MKPSFLSLLPILFLPLFIACTHSEPTLVHITSAEGANHCSLRFHLPPEMDTAFTWVDRSDNRGDACRKFRFQSSGLPVEMESGFFHTEPSPDSIQRMTVIHHEYEEWMDSIQPSISKQAEVHFNMNSAEINDFKAEYDSVSISGVPFLKIEMERQGMRQLEYVCFTPLIYIRVESNLEDDAAFFDEIMDTIERARITSG